MDILGQIEVGAIAICVCRGTLRERRQRAVGGDIDPSEHIVPRAAVTQEERREKALHRVAIHVAGREVGRAAMRQDARGAALDAVV